MQYTKEVEEMVCVAKGPNHGPAPIPEEGKWIQAKEIKDISGLTHGIGWCAPQQGGCKLTLNVKGGVIEEALVETIGCSGMTHSAAMAAEILPGKTILEALNMVEGAFALLIMTASKIYACRDKHGLRPLSIGKLGDGYVVSSETCAFEVVGAEFIRDVAPGEVVIIDVNGLQSVDYSKFKHYNMCAMEYVYFARPDSDIEGTNVHAFRKETGRMLYEEAPVDADIVVGVPDSSLSAAIGYSEASGIPYEMGLIKNKYVGRTFIQPSQELREKGVRMKLSPVRSIVEGKRLVIVDDSIVRGTTSRRIVKMLRQSGAKEIHMRIASPAITHPCFYGVDMSTYDELICAREKDLEAVRRLIGADSLVWLSPEALYKAAGGRKELCIACFNGRYPTALYQSIHDVNKDKKC